jgi:sterol desaturase/sphingolipid hydroxylase (fatty acid hydroxylase superfamily)
MMDIKYVIANIFFFVLIVPPLVLNFVLVEKGVTSGLTFLLGEAAPTTLSPYACKLIITIALFFAYEIAYWTDHYCAHKIPFLWEFHKVHHSATVLTPFTNWRVHPIDTAVFFNFVAFFSAIAHGITNYLLNQAHNPVSMVEANAILLVYFYLYGHLQHSQVWMSFSGKAGYLFMSPAHHQIHHSNDPIHYDKNFGGSLALFDWLFGTLHRPSAKREALTFGVDRGMHLQAFLPSVIYPCFYGMRALLRWRPFRRRRQR